MLTLPPNWKIVEFPGSIQIEDEKGNFIGGCGRPYDPTPMEEIIDYILKPIKNKNMKDKVWSAMFSNVEDFRDASGEINTTALAEWAIDKFNLGECDETHWVWEVAFKVEKQSK